MLALVLFLTFANLVVVQYGRGAIRSALEQGVRSGSVAGEAACLTTVSGVVSDLLGGRMSDDLTAVCRVSGGTVVASARATFESWTPLTPNFDVAIEVVGTAEP